MDKMYRFEVFTDCSEGFVYAVKYFDFPNIVGFGETIEEAIKEADGNLCYYIQYCKEKGIEIPEPSVHEELEVSGKVTLRMSKTLHKHTIERATKEGVSLNSLLCEAISNYIYSKNVAEKIVEKSQCAISEVFFYGAMKDIEYKKSEILEKKKNKYSLLNTNVYV